MEIKVGDKIKLKSNIIKRHHVSEYSIKKLSNKILTVSDVFLDGVKILEDDVGYIWFFDMFDKIEEKNHINSIYEELKKELETKKREIQFIEGEIKAYEKVLKLFKEE